MFNPRKLFDIIVTLFYTLFSLTKATDPPSTFVGVRRFDPVDGDNALTFYDEVGETKQVTQPIKVLISTLQVLNKIDMSIIPVSSQLTNCISECNSVYTCEGFFLKVRFR